MALAAVAAGADGLILEVHPEPGCALSDGPQSLYPDQFEKMMRDIQALAPVLGKEVARVPEEWTLPLREETVGKETKKGSSRQRVAFQGERGAFSEMALIRFFDNDDFNPEPCGTFRDVFDAVLAGRTDFGILPIENSLSGSIHENYDLLLQYPDIKIAGEQKIRIVHNLIGLPGTTLKDIRNVYSHPQGIAQCSQFLDRYPAWNRVPFYDTAGSVAHIAAEGNQENGAIASLEAAKVHKMEIIKEGIETNPRNYTRFVILAREEHAEVADPNTVSIVFSTPDKPGALYLFLKVLAERHLNMKKLESRPIPGKPWQYMFYADIEMMESLSQFSEATAAMKKETEDFRILGIYRI
jgi:prephenate dehydratase